MNHSDIAMMMKGIAPVVRAYVEQQLGPLLIQVKELEARQAETSRATIAELRMEVLALKADLKSAADGQAARVDEALARIKDGSPGERGEKGDPGQPGAPGEPGKDAEAPTAEQVAAAVLSHPDAISEAVRSYLEENPPKAGADGPAGAQGDAGPRGEKGDTGEPGPAGERGADGESVDPDEVLRMVLSAVEKAVAEIPVQKGDKGEPGPIGERGADGVGLAGAVIDRSGDLVVTLTDGSTRALGSVVGKDGAPGANGVDGKDGRDGFGFEDLAAEMDGDRTIVLCGIRGEERKEFGRFVLPIPIDRGPYKEGREYQRGDAVSFGGSMFIAQEPTAEKPELSKAWRLAVKRGRDGKDGVVKHEAPPKPVKVT